MAVGGADVAITYHRSPDEAAAVVKEIEAVGRRGVAIPANAADAKKFGHGPTLFADAGWSNFLTRATSDA